MKRSVLITILVVQLILVAVVWGLRLNEEEFEPEVLLSFEPGVIQKVEISASDDERRVTLVRNADDWRFESGIPADGDKVEQFLSKLANTNSGWPVAEQDSTAERFEVTKENHQRHIVLSDADNVLGGLYLGTSPGYQKVHARAALGGAVYSIKFSAYEAGMDTSSWLDRSILQPVGEVRELALEGVFTLSKDDDKRWESDQNRALDQDAVQTFINRFRNLTVMDVHEEAIGDDPLMTYVVSDDDGAQRLSIVRIEKPEDDSATSRYVVSSDRQEGHFELASYLAERIETSLDDLVISESEVVEEDTAVDG
ncbi:MAG: DUF4340 domain-containing protein [Pseudomonadales bacterium]|nr:DUF4340 domain-containing protein [Pseudomonadales bacterium]